MRALGTDPTKTPSPEKPDPQAGHDQWMASLASASEEAVKADRTAAWDDKDTKYKGMQDKSKKVAEEMKDSTASLTDGLWRSVGGGR